MSLPMLSTLQDSLTTTADSLASVSAGAALVSTQAVPDAPPYGLEVYLLQQDKLYVVAAVLTVIWIGIALFIARTDRRIARLEKLADERESFDRAKESPTHTTRIDSL